MKKIFLLSLLFTFLLSAFSQNFEGKTEILYQINITKTADADEEEFNPERLPGWSWFWWWNNYRWVIWDPFPWGGENYCIGLGPNTCFKLKFRSEIRGISEEVTENTLQELFYESGERALNEEFKGTASRKIVSNEDKSLILFQIKWDYDPKNIRTGKAEITISKTTTLGI